MSIGAQIGLGYEVIPSAISGLAVVAGAIISVRLKNQTQTIQRQTVGTVKDHSEALTALQAQIRDLKSERDYFRERTEQLEREVRRLQRIVEEFTTWGGYSARPDSS